jgi:hypothetical protein
VKASAPWEAESNTEMYFGSHKNRERNLLSMKKRAKP